MFKLPECPICKNKLTPRIEDMEDEAKKQSLYGFTTVDNNPLQLEMESIDGRETGNAEIHVRVEWYCRHGQPNISGTTSCQAQGYRHEYSEIRYQKIRYGGVRSSY